MTVQSSVNPILARYLHFTSGTEPPKQFHRWAFISCCAAVLGRRVFMKHGHRNVYPSMYIILAGPPGTRKSSAINIAKNLLADSGYLPFSFDKSSKEKFLLDWSEGAFVNKADKLTDMLDAPLEQTNEVFCALDEFVDFLGVNNVNFISLLTVLWDCKPVYAERLKNSISVSIDAPTCNLLGGVTPTGLAQALPAEASGQGFFSRLVMVYSEPTGRKIAFPEPPDESLRKEFIDFFSKLIRFRAEIKVSPEAKRALTVIYERWENKDDVKLEYYAGRRFEHLLRLTITLTAMQFKHTIEESDVIEANTILCYTEQTMARSLSEFGTAQNLSSTSKVLNIITNSDKPLRIDELWKQCISYFNKIQDLSQVVDNLRNARKITVLKDHGIVAIPSEPINFGKYVNYELYIEEFESEHQRSNTLEVT